MAGTPFRVALQWYRNPTGSNETSDQTMAYYNDVIYSEGHPLAKIKEGGPIFIAAPREGENRHHRNAVLEAIGYTAIRERGIMVPAYMWCSPEDMIYWLKNQRRIAVDKAKHRNLAELHLTQSNAYTAQIARVEEFKRTGGFFSNEPIGGFWS